MDASAESTKWDNHYIKEIDRLHVTPVGDSIPHCPSETCFCQPSIELIERPDGSVGTVYLHRVVRDQDA